MDSRRKTRCNRGRSQPHTARTFQRQQAEEISDALSSLARINGSAWKWTWAESYRKGYTLQPIVPFRQMVCLSLLYDFFFFGDHATFWTTLFVTHSHVLFFIPQGGLFSRVDWLWRHSNGETVGPSCFWLLFLIVSILEIEMYVPYNSLDIISCHSTSS